MRTARKKIDVNIEELLGSPNQNPSPWHITLEDFKRIEASILETDLSPLVDRTPDTYKMDGDAVLITPGQFFMIWRAIARIGNPGLILSVIEDPTPVIYIGGFNAYY